MSFLEKGGMFQLLMICRAGKELVESSARLSELVKNRASIILFLLRDLDPARPKHINIFIDFIYLFN